MFYETVISTVILANVRHVGLSDSHFVFNRKTILDIPLFKICLPKFVFYFSKRKCFIIYVIERKQIAKCLKLMT